MAKFLSETTSGRTVMGKWSKMILPPFASGRGASEDQWDKAFPNRPKREWESSDRETVEDGYAERVRKLREANEPR